MSWDVSMVIDTGGEEPATVADCGNYTYNVADMYYLAMPSGGLCGLDGLSGEAALPVINGGLKYMTENANELRKLNPKNGWGSYDGAVKFLTGIRDACVLHPKAFVEVR